MAATNKSYSTSINDIASGAYANIADSINHSKSNIITLDKLCNWYLFEGQALIPMPYLNKYKDTLINNSYWVEIDPIFYYKPEYVSYNLYGTTDLWYLMLFLNEMKSVEEFNKPHIRVLNPNKMTVLKNIINSETNKYTRDNPKYISKHYIKNPNLPSEQLLPDDDLVEIMSPGINNIKEIPIDNLAFETSIMDYYYKGKSKMELYRVIEKTYIDTREYHYMDGIRISNSNSHAVYEKKYNGYERKLTGWINMAGVAGIKPKDLVDKDTGEYTGYEFIVNGINGTAYVTINNQSLMDKDGNAEIIFSGTEKQYDYFERESRNSDFKQRNTVGWTVESSKQRVATDKEVMKPVFIIDDLSNVDGDVIYGELTSKQLSVATEPYGDNIDGDLFLTFNIKTLDVKDAQIMPFVEVTYDDGTIDREYAFDSDWRDFVNTQGFVEVYLLYNFTRGKTFSNDNAGIKFGLEIISTLSNPATIKGAVRLESISVHRINRNMIRNTNLIITNDWVPYTIVYRHNGTGAAMFNMLWKTDKDDVFTAIPQDCIAIAPDSRDMSNSPASMKECILVTAEGKELNDNTYREILVSRFDRQISIGSSHNRLVYHTNIAVSPNEKLYVENINFPHNKFTVRINKKIPEYIDGEGPDKFTPWKYVDGLSDIDPLVLADLGGGIGVLIEIIDENPYKLNDIVRYSVRSDVSGIVDAIPDRRFYIDPLTLNHSDKTTNEDGIDTYDLEMSKTGLTEVNIYTKDVGIMSNKEQFMLEFDLTIDTPDRGLFIVNIDKEVGNDNRKSMLSFLYTGETEGDAVEPKYYIDTYAYKVDDINPTSVISNIDRGIDWYKYPYRSMYLFKNSLEFNDPLNIDDLKLYKGKQMRIFVRKNKQSIILGIQDLTDETSKMKMVGSWLDPDWETTLGGICSFQFLNIRRAEISNLKFNM